MRQRSKGLRPAARGSQRGRFDFIAIVGRIRLRYLNIMQRFLISFVVMLASIGAAQPLVYLLQDDMEGKSPAQLGELVLRGEDHGQITEVSFVENIGPMMPSNEGSIHLKEMPQRIGDGCKRTSFRAYFVIPAEGDPEERWVRFRVTSQPEVAWSPMIPCVFATYARMMPPLGPADSIKRLGELEAFRKGDRAFACRSETSETFCDDPDRLRRNISRMPVWMILKRRDGTTFWLGKPGPVVWVVLPSDPDKSAYIAQKIPAPF